MYKREHIKPAILRPGMYTGEQGDRSDADYLADAVAAYLNARNSLISQSGRAYNDYKSNS